MTSTDNRKVITHTSMDIALLLLLSWLFWSSSMTRPWLAVPLPLFTRFPCVFLWRAGLGGSKAAPLGDSRPCPLLGLGLGTWEGLGVSGGLGWAVKAADCWDCCMWTGELWTWWMTTGEEGITSDLMVELCGSSEGDAEPDWADGGAASAGGSADAAAAEVLLLTGTLAEGSGPFWGPSEADLQRGGKQNAIQTLVKQGSSDFLLVQQLKFYLTLKEIYFTTKISSTWIFFFLSPNKTENTSNPVMKSTNNAD